MADLFKGLKNFIPETTAELKRLNTQASMELANAIFNGSAFVPYGPGQYTPTPEMEKAGHDKDAEELQKENTGMEM